MTRTARVSAAGAFFLLVGLGLVFAQDGRELTATSFGTIPNGYGALYSLLRELGLPTTRNYAPPDQLPPTATVWWISAGALCRPPTTSATSSEARRKGVEALEAFVDLDPGSWVSKGGTAVVLLPARGGACADGDTVAGVSLPRRRLPALASPSSQRASALDPTPASVDQRVSGALVPQPRRLETEKLAHFVSAPGAKADTGAWRVQARLDGHPFVLERKLGAGRLILVADARFLTNRWLDRADAAPLVVDLVRAFGVPRIDERAHGFSPPQSALAYLLRSAALPFLIGVFLLGAVFAWRGAQLPPRRVAEIDPSAPTLDTFVDSLAAFYAGTRDHARVLGRYRELTASRLRRHFGMAPETPLAALAARLDRRRGLSAEGLEILRSGVAVRTRAELEQAASRLDRLVEEATR